jgi:hypothetical protein
MVRVKCSCCEYGAKIAYQGLTPEDDRPRRNRRRGPEVINKANDPSKVARAETCDDCHTYRKIFNQEHDYNVDAAGRRPGQPDAGPAGRRSGLCPRQRQSAAVVERGMSNQPADAAAAPGEIRLPAVHLICRRCRLRCR